MTTIDTKRTGWMQLFSQSRAPTGFLTSLFQSRPGNRFSGEEVSFDVQRFDEEVAIAITPGSGPRQNKFDNFTNKKIVPPWYNEGMPLNVNDLLQRMAGHDPFSASYESYGADLVSKVNQGLGLLDAKIQRAMELQAAQVITEGTVTSVDENGDTIYTIDYNMKAAHKITAGTDWSNAAAGIITDLLTASGLVRTNGKARPGMALLGKDVVGYVLNNTEIKARLDNRRMELGTINPAYQASGAVYYGDLQVGPYRLELWTYPEEYKHPQTGNATPYIPDDYCVVMASNPRFDRVSAAVPLPIGPDPRVAKFLPGRLASDQFDVTPNAYCSADGKTLQIDLESRTLMVPTQIDSFVRIDTIA